MTNLKLNDLSYEAAPIPVLPPADGARHDQFDSTWASTRSALLYEAGRLDADRVVIAGAWKPGQIRRDGHFVGGRVPVPATPGITVHLIGTRLKRDPSYPVGTFISWQANVRAVALGLEHLRAVGRYGVASQDEQYRGFAQLTAGAAGPSAERGRLLIANAGGKREAIKLYHPDRGGDESDWADVSAAIEATP